MDAGDQIALVALIVSIASLAVAVWAIRYAKSSAKSARDSANEAARLRRIEADRRHAELAPKPIERLEACYEGTPPDLGTFTEFTVDGAGAYRIQVFAITDGTSRIQLCEPMLIHAGRSVYLQIDPSRESRGIITTRELLIKFWPPLESDDTDPWSCPCGKPTGETADAPGHWEQRVPVDYRPAFQIL